MGSDASNAAGGSTGATSVGIAAAVDVNVLTTSAVASIDNGLKVTSTGGSLTVQTANQASALGLADGRATATGKSSQTSIGAAVSVNVANVTNTATIGAGDTISAGPGGVTVAAGMVVGLDGSPMVNDFSDAEGRASPWASRAPVSRGRSGSTLSRSIPRRRSAVSPAR